MAEPEPRTVASCMRNRSSRKYDLVVFGATGYTGKFVVEEIYRIKSSGKENVKWAVAGRNEGKLRAALVELGIPGDAVDVLQADISDVASLEAMCSSAKVIINCVGPYQLYGEPVVKACIDQQCDYVDITGETFFVEEMLFRHGDRAREAGVYIVNSCGFDCIPNDLGALVLRKAFNGELAFVESYMRIENSPGLNIGTWESFLRSIRNRSRLMKLRRERGAAQLTLPAAKPPNRGNAFFSNVTKCWTVPFPGPDRATILRSQEYFQAKESSKPFHVRVYSSLDSLCQLVTMVIAFLFLVPLAHTNFGLNLMLKYPSLFSGGLVTKTGPNKKLMDRTKFSVTLVGTGYSTEQTDRSLPPSASLRVRVHGAEPGYISTSAMMVQSGLCLVNERDKLPKYGGIYSPAAVFGDTNIIRNLEETGKVKFEISQS